MNLSQFKNEMIFYNLNEVCQINIKSKNWKQNLQTFNSITNKNKLKQVNIQLDFKIVKRICDHVNLLKKRIFPSLEMIIFIITQSEQKYIDFSELNRICMSLERTLSVENIQVKIIHPFDCYTIPIKQIRFIYKQKVIEQKNIHQKTKSIDINNKQSMEKKRIRIIEQFYIHFKNIKQKITFPFKLSEEMMINSSSIQQIIDQVFQLNKFLLSPSQKLHPIFTIDSVNIGEVDLSRDISGSFIVFLNEFLNLLDVTKIKSLSFKAKQSQQQSSLLKEYLFTFAKFLSKCNELSQIQIILDFNNADITESSVMFRHLVLNSLSQNICPKLIVVDISFSNIGENNSKLINELSIDTFLQSRIDKLKQFNIRFYSGEPQNKQKQLKNKYLNFFVQSQKFGIEEQENNKEVRHLIIEFNSPKELKLFLKSKVQFYQLLLFGNSKNTIEVISEQMNIEQKKNLQTSYNNVISLDIFQVIQEKSLDELWTVLINELFMSCKNSIQTIICNIQFDESIVQLQIQSQNQKNQKSLTNQENILSEILENKLTLSSQNQLQTNYTSRAELLVKQRIESIAQFKIQQRRPFELMILNILQQINYKQLKKVVLKNTIYDITFNQLMLKSICANKLIYFEVSDIIKIDEEKNIFKINITNQTNALLEMMSYFKYTHFECSSSMLSFEQILQQIQLILSKKSSQKQIQSFKCKLNLKLSADQLDQLLNIVKFIPSLNIENQSYHIQVENDTVTYKQNQIFYTVLNCLGNLGKKILKLYIDFQDQDCYEVNIFKHFKFVSVYFGNTETYLVYNHYPSLVLASSSKVYKIVLYGLKKKVSVNKKMLIKFANLANATKIIDLFLVKKRNDNLTSNSGTKLIKILQSIKNINSKLKLRKEIINTLLFEYIL